MRRRRVLRGRVVRERDPKLRVHELDKPGAVETRARIRAAPQVAHTEIPLRDRHRVRADRRRRFRRKTLRQHHRLKRELKTMDRTTDPTRRRPLPRDRLLQPSRLILGRKRIGRTQDQRLRADKQRAVPGLRAAQPAQRPLVTHDLLSNRDVQRLLHSPAPTRHDDEYGTTCQRGARRNERADNDSTENQRPRHARSLSAPGRRHLTGSSNRTLTGDRTRCPYLGQSFRSTPHHDPVRRRTGPVASMMGSYVNAFTLVVHLRPRRPLRGCEGRRRRGVVGRRRRRGA